MIQLTRRERRLGISVAVALAGWGLYALAVGPMRDRIRLLNRIIPEKQQELRELRAKSDEFLALDRAFADAQERIDQQDPDFQLLPFLESLTERPELEAYLARMEQLDAPGTRPEYAETLVEIGLQGIPLRHLLGLLRALEDSSVATQIASLHIRKPAEGKHQLDATIQIYSPKAHEDASIADLSL